MYDEFDDREERNEQGINGGMEPEIPEAEEPIEESDFHAEESDGQSETYVSETSDSGCETETEENGFYHYSYNRETGEQPQPFKQPKAVKDPKKKPLWRSFAVCAGLALVFGVVSSAAFQATNYVGKKVSPKETEMTVGTADTVVQTEAKKNPETVDGEAVSVTGQADIRQVAKNAMPSIVAITNKGVEEVQSMFFGQTYQQQTESAGSGVIIAQNDTELLIVSNNHVVEGAQELSVCFSVDTEDPENAVVKAQTKGTDPSHDLAIVAVNLSDIPDDIKNQIKVIPIGDSDSLEMGQQVVAIGNALGYGQSLTVGYVSALNREVTVDDITNNMIQTDAAINFGNSGGALLNTAGELVGINSVKAASEGVEGMGYAIPMNTAMPILNELMNRQTRTEVDASEMGYLGVVPRDVSDEAKEVYNMPAGAFIYEVSEGSAAEAAGLKKGDIITKLDGQTISSREDLFDRMNYYKAGETIDLVVATAEGGEYVERTVSVTLDKRPEDAATEEQQENSQDGYRQEIDPNSGYGDGSMGNPFEQFFNNY